MKKIAQLIIALLIAISANANEFKIISGVDVEPDFVLGGVKGINITYRYNFLPLEEYDHNDTILKDANFSINTTIVEDGKNIKTAKGFQSVTNDKGNLEYATIFNLADIEASKFDKKIVQFIPYAALNLPEGKHFISIKAFFSGKDGSGKFHSQNIQKDSIAINKPPTKIFTMNIDYIELNILNTNGNSWDYGVFKTDAPDVGVNLLVGNTSVWKTNVNDTYMFAVGPNSKNISFTISANDKVTLLVQDIDVMFNDFVAKLLFTTGDRKTGTLYAYNKAKGNIKSCNLTFKIE